MIAYAEKTTKELIELLVAEEDRVTLEHVQELAARADAVEPLCFWLRDEKRWREAEDGEWWALYHAFIILSLTRSPKVLGDLLQGLLYADEEDFDWIIGIVPAAFAQFGEAAIEPLTQFIIAQRSRTHWSAGFMRADLIFALTRIALENPEAAPRIANFICNRFSDPQEFDPVFLGSITGNALSLDKESALEPIRSAFERGVVDESIAGDFEQTVKWFASHDESNDRQYHNSLVEFYEPEEIAKRQDRWRREKEDEERRAKRKEASELERRLGLHQGEAIVPDGYFQAAEGNFVREEKIGRNDPCSCGSGKKYKKCHGQ